MAELSPGRPNLSLVWLDLLAHDSPNNPEANESTNAELFGCLLRTCWNELSASSPHGSLLVQIKGKNENETKNASGGA